MLIQNLVTLNRYAKRALSEAGNAVAVHELSILAAAASAQTITQTAIVDLSGIDRSTVNASVKLYVRKGWLKVVKLKSADQRTVQLSLTAKGGKRLSESAAVVDAANKAFTSKLKASKQLADGLGNALAVVRDVAA